MKMKLPKKGCKNCQGTGKAKLFGVEKQCGCVKMRTVTDANARQIMREEGRYGKCKDS
jgi:hypothetical protein